MSYLSRIHHHPHHVIFLLNFVFPSLVGFHLLCLLEFEYFIKIIPKKIDRYTKKKLRISKGSRLLFHVRHRGRMNYPRSLYPWCWRPCGILHVVCACDNTYRRSGEKNVSWQSTLSLDRVLTRRTPHQGLECSIFYCYIHQEVGRKWKRFKQLCHGSQ